MNSYEKISQVKSGEHLRINAFHGSPAEFDEFQLGDPRKSPGVWFSIDKDYVSCIGNNIYTCEIDCKRVLVCDDYSLSSAAETLELGFDAQIMVFGGEDDASGPRDAFIIVSDPSLVKIMTKQLVGSELTVEDSSDGPRLI